MDWKKEEERIIEFIRNKVKTTGTKGVVLGLSGGLDSAIVYKLCIKALGKSNVFAICIPSHGHSVPEEELMELCGCDYVSRPQFWKEIHLDQIPILFYSGDGFEEHTNISRGNFMARSRMVIFYTIANLKNYLVIGTTNKSEYKIGYFTKYGDGACDLEPIQHLYKTELFEFAKYLGIPKCIIDKAPSAGLWEGQTDEGEIGMSYKRLDKILNYLDLVGKYGEHGIQNTCSHTQLQFGISKQSINQKDLKIVIDKVIKSQHKRLPIPCLENQKL